MINSEQNRTQPKCSPEDWTNFEEAADCLTRFCLLLNYHFQGKKCDIELSSRW